MAGWREMSEYEPKVGLAVRVSETAPDHLESFRGQEAEIIKLYGRWSHIRTRDGRTEQAIWPYLLVSTTLPSLELRPLDSQADLQLGLRVWVKSTAYGYRDLAGREGEIVRVRGNFADVACQPGEGNFHFSELLARRGAAGVTAPHDPPPRASRPASGQGGYHSHQHNATPPGGPGPNTESRRVKRWGDGLDAPAAGSRNFFPQGFQVTLEVPEAIQRFGHSVARVSDIMESPILNYAMRTPHTDTELRQYADYIVHMERALSILPAHVSELQGYVYRGVSALLNPETYAAGRRITWQSFSSATKRQLATLDFVSVLPGRRLHGSLFVIDSITAKDIRHFSAIPSEEEVLFPPNSQFLVARVLTGVDVPTPELGGESITEGNIAEWIAKVGENVKKDQVIATIETDKVTVDVKAPQDGQLLEIKIQADETCEVGQVLAVLGPSGEGAPAAAPEAAAAAAPAAEAPAAAPKAAPKAAPAPKAAAPAASATSAPSSPERGERREKMTRMRQAIARNLKESQNTLAMLTTFQEVDMSGLIKMRKEYKDIFQSSHGAKLGFQSPFFLASAHALKQIPALNAYIDNATNEVVFRDYINIGFAAATPKGLVTPVIKNMETKNLAEVESEFARFAGLAKQDKLSMDDITGNTFTITNGGAPPVPMCSACRCALNAPEPNSNLARRIRQ
ncbi:dlst [Symbiodinium natans]|uniref:Multifunctional fusion protein n=1 Tax=Symbiodinium natans TaxID=878477 RepID=A0A812P8L0_9DINO|nr:dlst [Symbiodinium natans]